MHDEAFREVKRIINSALVPAVPTSEPDAPPFELGTDASDVPVGGVLLQKDRGERQHVIAYQSTRLNKRMRQKVQPNVNYFFVFTIARHLGHYLIAKKVVNENGLPGADLVEKHEGDSPFIDTLVRGAVTVGIHDTMVKE